MSHCRQCQHFKSDILTGEDLGGQCKISPKEKDTWANNHCGESIYTPDHFWEYWGMALHYAPKGIKLFLRPCKLGFDIVDDKFRKITNTGVDPEDAAINLWVDAENFCHQEGTSQDMVNYLADYYDQGSC